jgi:hypothetical protein
MSWRHARARAIALVDRHLDSFSLEVALRDGHEEQRFSEIRGFAERFESGGAGDVFALGHQAQEFIAVEPMERQCLVNAPFRRGLGFVVKAVQGDLWIALVPLGNLRRVTVIEQVNQNEIPGWIRMQLEKLSAQKRRDHYDVFLRHIRRLVERQRQPHRRRADKPHVPFHHELLETQAGRANIIGVAVHELMPNGDDWRPVAARERVNPRQRFEEIDNDVRF